MRLLPDNKGIFRDGLQRQTDRCHLNVDESMEQ